MSRGPEVSGTEPDRVSGVLGMLGDVSCEVLTRSVIDRRPAGTGDAMWSEYMSRELQMVAKVPGVQEIVLGML